LFRHLKAQTLPRPVTGTTVNIRPESFGRSVYFEMTGPVTRYIPVGVYERLKSLPNFGRTWRCSILHQTHTLRVQNVVTALLAATDKAPTGQKNRATRA